MKRVSLFYLLGLFTLFTSCEEDFLKNEKEEADVRTINITIYNASSWDESKGSDPNNLDKVANANVYLTSQTGILSAVTDENGIASFNDVEFGYYTIKASTGELNSLIEIETMDGADLGYLIDGVYTSQQEIENGPETTNSQIGGLRFRDLNGDGIVNSNDKSLGESLSFEQSYKDFNGNGIIDDNDKVDGAYQKNPSIVDMVIFVGR